MGSVILTYVQKQLAEYSDLLGLLYPVRFDGFYYGGLQVEEGRM